jgi:hypothetical protein
MMYLVPISIVFLVQVLCAHSSLCPYLIPFLLEKLDSTIVATKLEVLTTLSAACEAFGVAPLRIFLSDIWDMLRQDILHNQHDDDAITSAALQTLRAMAAMLATESEVNQARACVCVCVCV